MKSSRSQYRSGWVLIAAVGLGSAASFADDPRVEVNADVVRMSNQGNSVDPSLASMKDTFGKEGLSFSSYQRLSSQKVVLSQKRPSEIALPNQQKAVLKLESLKRGAANIAVSIGAVSTTYTLGREGSVFINFAHQNDGEMVLVLSPITAKRPRHLTGGVRPVAEGMLVRATSR